MKDTLDIKAMLIPVGREIHAKPGDRLIVVAGLCVGVYTGDAGIPIQPTTTVQEEPTPKKRGPYNKGPRTLSNISGTKVDGTPIKSVAPVVDAMREFFKKHDQATATELRRAFYVQSDGKAWRVRDACSFLLAMDEIEATGNSSNRMYHSKRKAA